MSGKIIPPILYIPTTGEDTGSENVSLVYQRLEDGRLALVAYTALDRLLDGCGPQQSWVGVPTSDLDDIRAQKPFDIIFMDATLHQPSPEEIESL